jgi:hypothetical protein
MTSDGGHVINGHLAGLKPGDGGFFRHETQTDEKINAAVDRLDSAFSKWNRPEPILVYRGINKGIPDEFDYDDNGYGWVEKTMPVGSTYQPSTYMSTTLDPDKAVSFAGSGVMFEILTRKTAPVVNFSAWDVVERELMTPRNQKFKVVNIIKNVPYGKKNNKTYCGSIS